MNTRPNSMGMTRDALSRKGAVVEDVHLRYLVTGTILLSRLFVRNRRRAHQKFPHPRHNFGLCTSSLTAAIHTVSALSPSYLRTRVRAPHASQVHHYLAPFPWLTLSQSTSSEDSTQPRV